MKKIIFLLLFIFPLFASNNLNINNKNISNKQNLIKKYLQNGKTYLQTNNINLAIAAFERVLIYEPQNDEAKFYLGKIFINKNIELATKYFKSIKNPTPKMKLFLDTFLKQHQKLKFNLYTKIGVGFDTNINNTTNFDKWDIFVNNKEETIQNNSNKKSAFDIHELLSLTPITQSNFQQQFTIYNKTVIDNGENNFFLLEYLPSIKQKYKKYNFIHYFGFDYIRYGNKNYQNRFRIGENIKFNFKQNHTSITNLELSYNKSIQKNSTMPDYYELNLYTQLIKHLHKTNLSLNLGLQHDNTLNLKDEIIYTTFKSGIMSNFYFNKKRLILGMKYNIKKYQNQNILFHKKQYDRILDYNVIFNYYHLFTYQTKIEYFDYISNIKPYSYKKWLLEFNIIKQFKGI